MTPLIHESMGIGATAAGLLVSVTFGIAVVTSLPVGTVLDRTDTRVAMAVSVITVFVGAWGWWAAEQGDYGSLLASRLVAGIAFIVVWNGDRPRRRSRYGRSWPDSWSPGSPSS